MSRDSRDAGGKTHQANTGLPKETPVLGSPGATGGGGGKDGPPCAAQLQPCRHPSPRPPCSPEPLKPFFSPSHPPTHRGLVQEQVSAGCGAVGSPARGCCQPGSPGHGASPRSWLGLGGRGSFARFGRVSRRLSAGVPTAFPSRCAAAEPVQPVRPTARRERRGGHSRGRLGTRPRNSGFKGRVQGHPWARWQSRVQPPALPGAGPERAGCRGIPAPPPAGKAIVCNRA